MSQQEHRSPPGLARIPQAGPRGPRWRALLEARWQARVREVTELSLAYHCAAASVADQACAGPAARRAEVLLHRTVAARRQLADVEEALGRLASGEFGSCEQCGAAIPAGRLAVVPESRYCPPCDAAPAQANRGAGGIQAIRGNRASRGIRGIRDFRDDARAGLSLR